MDDLPGKRKKNKAKQSPSDAGLSRRDFLKISGASAAAPLIARATVLSAHVLWLKAQVDRMPLEPLAPLAPQDIPLGPLGG